MRNIIIFALAIALFAGAVSAELKIYEGGGGDNKWHNPANWNPPGVPGSDDDATIGYSDNVDASDGEIYCRHLVNHGGIINASWIAAASITNYGHIHNEIGNSLQIYVDNDINNTGTIMAFGENADLGLVTVNGGLNNTGNIAGQNKLIIDALWMENSGITNSYGNTEIKTSERLDNDGTIKTENNTGDGAGDNIDISCMNEAGDAEFVNTGTIKGGDGAAGCGGDNIGVRADHFNNSGSIVGGDGGAGAPGGALNFIVRVILNLLGLIGKGYSDGGWRTSLDPIPANMYITGDSIDIQPGDSLICAGHLYIYGRVLRFSDINNFAGIMGESLVEIKTTSQEGRVADFSGAHTTGSIFSLSSIQIISDSIIEPTEGLNEICEPDPFISGGSIVLERGTIIGSNAADISGASDSIRVLVRNESSASKMLSYTINSVLGWVTPVSDTTDSLDPWEAIAFYVQFTIPPGLTETTVDTVDLELYLDSPPPCNTDKVFITGLFDGSVGIDKYISRIPDNLSISIHPNPFNSAVSISAPEGAIVEIFDINGRNVFETPVGDGSPVPPSSRRGDLAPTNIIWQPSAAISSGVYLVRAKVGDESLSKRVVYLK